MATSYFNSGWTANYSRAAISSLGNVNSGGSLFMPIGDFNGDGHLDIISMFGTGQFGQAISEPMPGRMILLLGKGNGQFTDGTSTLPGQGDFDALIRKFAVADFNGDGRDDLAMSLNWESGRDANPSDTNASPQFAFLSRGDHLAKFDLDFTTWGHAFATGDLNADGRLDFVIGGFTADPDSTYGAAAYLQNADGSLTQKWLQDVSGSSLVIGDFDNDGEVEMVDTYASYNGPDLSDLGMRLVELDADGDTESAIKYSEGAFTLVAGEGWNGPSNYVVRQDASGKQYVDGGLQELKVVDINSDGRLDVVGVRSSSSFTMVNGQLVTGPHETHLDFFTFGANGLERLDIKMDGGTDISSGFSDYQFMDFNGDGHEDIVILRWAGVGPEASPLVMLNDGAGHFSAIKQSLLPSLGDYPMPTAATVLDANEDGIMDVYFHASGWDPGWSHWSAKSDTVMLGTKRFYTGPSYANPALKGAAGFNESYYLHSHADAQAAVNKHKYASGLDHYLKVGKDKGYFGFAEDTHVFGSDKADKITLRGGDEWADGGNGNDTIKGGAGADQFRFTTKLGTTNVDIVKDFKHNVDLIALDNSIFKKIGAALETGEFYAKSGAVKAHDKGDRIVYDTKSGKLYYDDDGKGGHAAVHFATLSGHPPLDAGDFGIV